MNLLKISKEEARKAKAGYSMYCIYRDCHGFEDIYAELNLWARAGAFPCNMIP